MKKLSEEDIFELRNSDLTIASSILFLIGSLLTLYVSYQDRQRILGNKTIDEDFENILNILIDLIFLVSTLLLLYVAYQEQKRNPSEDNTDEILEQIFALISLVFAFRPLFRQLEKENKMDDTTQSTSKKT